MLDLLKGIQQNIEAAGGYITEMEQELRPSLEQLKTLHEKLKRVESIEQMGQELSILRKLAAWCEADEEERKYKEGLLRLDKYNSRKPTCEEKICKIQVCKFCDFGIMDERDAYKLSFGGNTSGAFIGKH